MNQCVDCKWCVREEFEDDVIEGCWRPNIPKCSNTPNGGPDYTYRQRRYFKPFDVLMKVCGSRGRFWEPATMLCPDGGTEA